MRKLIFPVLTLLLLAPFVRAADISGNWSGSAELKPPDGDSQVIPIHAEFKQQGKSLTGTIGKQGVGQWPIDKGRIEDGKINFEFEAPEGDETSGKRLYTVRLSAADEMQLQGEFDFAVESGKITGKLTLRRDK
jgi:hypothetical protein